MNQAHPSPPLTIKKCILVPCNLTQYTHSSHLRAYGKDRSRDDRKSQTSSCSRECKHYVKSHGGGGEGHLTGVGPSTLKDYPYAAVQVQQ